MLDTPITAAETRESAAEYLSPAEQMAEGVLSPTFFQADPFAFTPGMKVFISTSHKPKPGSDLGLWHRREIPRRLMMATTAIHQLGDISRAKPELCLVTEEDLNNFYGNWALGFGYVGVRFPKATTRELTEAEVAQQAALGFGIDGKRLPSKATGNTGTLLVMDDDLDRDTHLSLSTPQTLTEARGLW